MGRWRMVIGVDVGGTKIAAGLVQVGEAAGPDGPGRAEAPRILRRSAAPTAGSSAEACVAGILDCVQELLAADADVAALGVGVASMVDFAAGRVVESVNLPLRDVPLRDVLEERFDLPAVIDNDATAAAVGEHRFGAGRGTRDMLMLTIGTGVGGGIICDGRPYRGASGAAGELGHITIDMDGRPCPANCPNKGCLEAYVAGPAMAAAAVAEARDAPASALGRALASGEAVDGRLLTRLALSGDEAAQRVLTRIGEYLGVGLATLVNVFDPEVIVVGGGAAAAGELLLQPARRVLAARALPPGRDAVRVVPAALGADAGLVGAAAVALDGRAPEAAAAS